MKITQIRNATILIESMLEGKEEGILLDPMFAARGAIPSLKYATKSRRRNPLLELPSNMDELKSRITCCLITHCQKGHFDHLDHAATKWLRDSNIPVYCSIQDSEFLRRKGLDVHSLDPSSENSFLGGSVKLLPCLHGEGFIGKLMAHGYGYHIQLPDEPSLYVTGDTILTKELEVFVTRTQPDILVIPAGGAIFDIGGEIIMGMPEAIKIGELAKGQVIANHLEALDHCPVTRKSIRSEVQVRAWEHRFFVPNDGESLVFNQEDSESAVL
jgi:L-ascorbate metabolism protein UlaG (beta-lactamase superfamily)